MKTQLLFLLQASFVLLGLAAANATPVTVTVNANPRQSHQSPAELEDGKISSSNDIFTGTAPPSDWDPAISSQASQN